MLFCLILLTCVFELSGGIRPRNQFECGKSKGKLDTVTGVRRSFAGESPWHVGVYRFIGDTFHNICCGSIISRHIVITAANCVYDQAKLHVMSPSEFKVVGGKLAYSWDEADSNAQEISVMSINVPKNYYGDVRSYSSNIALLGLTSEFDFNEFISPVCLSLGMVANPEWKYAGASGWGFKSNGEYSLNLKQATFSFLNIHQCWKQYSSRYRRFINHDKFCIITSEGRQNGDSGSGITFEDKGINYIYGVLSANVVEEFSLVTNVSRHAKWIKEEIINIDSIERCDGFQCHSGECIHELLRCDGGEDCEDGSDEGKKECGGLSYSNGRQKDTCILPKQKGGVSYTVVDCNKSPCELKPHALVQPNNEIILNCGKGYTHVDEAKPSFICSKGSWFPKDPQCIKLCPPLQKEFVSTKCFYRGEKVSCKEYARPQTTAEYECQDFYKIKDNFAFNGHMQCLASGNWDESLPTCIPECGIVNQRNNVQATVSGGQKAKYGMYPWHVGIFKLNTDNGSYDNICGGSIIHPHMVLTAAHCFFDLITGIRVPTSSFAVAAGKYKRNWNEHEENQQSINAQDINIPDTYAGSKSRYEHDIAIINLAKSYFLNEFVLPVCIDFDKRGIRPDSQGTIVGWGLTEKFKYSEELKEIQSSYITRQECWDKFPNFTLFVSTDKFCVINKNGSGAQLGDSGGGMTFPRNDIHFIHGIVSLKLSQTVNSFSALTNVTSHFQWIRNTISKYKEGRCSGFQCRNGKCIPEQMRCDGSQDCADGEDEDEVECSSSERFKNSCTLPKPTAGFNYTIVNCKDSSCEKPHHVVQSNKVIELSCGPGYDFIGVSSFICTQGVWFPHDPKCTKLCPPLQKKFVDTKCTHKGEKVSCEEYARPQTKVEYKCKSHYKSAHIFAFKGFTHCLESGEWEETLPTCVPECGIVNKRGEAQPLSGGALNTKFGKYPWHVGIFKTFKTNDSLMNICGGSIIHPHMVLSAAHCFFNEATGNQSSTSLFTVAAGKYMRDWYDFESTQQSINIRDIIIPEAYKGLESHYESDIAIINLSNSFMLNDFVLPVCLDFLNRGIDSSASLGTMVGWGLRENGGYSETLSEIQSPIVSREQCSAGFPQFRPYLTYDKFCVIYKQGSEAPFAAGGGGMTFPRSNLHFIHGVVAVKPARHNSFIAITNVTDHIQWIRDTISKYARVEI